MKFNVSKVLCDVNGNPVTENGVPVTFGAMMALCLLNSYMPRDQNAKAEEKLHRYRLAQTVSKDGIVDLNAKDVVLLQELGALGLSINAFGALNDFLENPEG